MLIRFRFFVIAIAISLLTGCVSVSNKVHLVSNASATTTSAAAADTGLQTCEVRSLMNENKLAYNWSSNLPHSYSWTIYNMRWEDINYSLVQPLKVLLFSGSLDDLMADIDKQVQLLENVQDVYSWTNVIWENDIITNITNLTINTVTPSENDKFVASTTIKYALNLDWIKIVWTPDPVITWPAILNITFIQADNQTYICTACD